MKKYLGLLFIFVLSNHLYSIEMCNNKHVILPRQLHVGQEFIYEGIPYIIKGFDQEKKDDCQKVTLVLEYPLTFGFEFGKETLILTVKQGIDQPTGTILDTHLQEYSYSYNWKAYTLGLFLIKYFKLVNCI